jgi:hypothetical protein
MRWIAPSEKDAITARLEKRLWDAACQFRANFGAEGYFLGEFTRTEGQKSDKFYKPASTLDCICP